MNDELVNTRLYNPHDHDFVYRRSDGSFYAIEIRKGKDDNTKELPGYEPWVAPSRPLQLTTNRLLFFCIQNVSSACMLL